MYNILKTVILIRRLRMNLFSCLAIWRRTENCRMRTSGRGSRLFGANTGRTSSHRFMGSCSRTACEPNILDSPKFPKWSTEKACYFFRNLVLVPIHSQQKPRASVQYSFLYCSRKWSLLIGGPFYGDPFVLATLLIVLIAFPFLLSCFSVLHR